MLHAIPIRIGRRPVQSLLYPAVTFMNRLSFAMKFSLISVLFFVPMLLTNFYLARDSYREFVGTRTELQSLELLGTALQVRRDMQDWTDLVEIEVRSEEHTSELQSRENLVCRLLLEKKNM